MSGEMETLAATDEAVTRGEVVGYGDPSDEELASINRFTRRPLARGDVYVVDARPSDSSIDSYHTRMDPETTLANYAEDAAAGVPILNSHGKARGMFATDLPIGRSFAGQVLTTDLTSPRGAKLHATKTKPALYSAFYLPRGLSTSTTSNDDMIRAIDAGVLSDLSVGYGDTKPRKAGYWYRCDECGGTTDGLRSDTCTHFPGMTLSKDGATWRVTWTVMDAGLREYSPVWRGANPTAEMLRKAGDLVTRGVLSYADVADIDRVTGRHMATALDWQALKGGRTLMTTPTTDTDAARTVAPPATDARDATDARRAVLDEALAGGDARGETEAEGDEATETTDHAHADDQAGRSAPPPATVEHPLARVLGAAGIVDEAALRVTLAEAEAGRQYRTDLVDLNHKAGVRAFGAEYRRELHDKTLATLTVPELQESLAERNGIARARFGKDNPKEDADPLRSALAARVGGRQTVAGDGPLGQHPGSAGTPGQGAQSGTRVSNSAYKTRKTSRV